MSGNGLIGEIIVVTSRLLEVLEREVEYLRTGRVGEVTPLQTEKLQLVGAYEVQLKRLRDEPSLFSGVAPTLRDELETAMKRLDRAVDRNVKALEAAREVNRRMMDAIVRATADQTAGRGYGNTGARPRAAMPSGRQAVSITLDQRL